MFVSTCVKWKAPYISCWQVTAQTVVMSLKHQFNKCSVTTILIATYVRFASNNIERCTYNVVYIVLQHVVDDIRALTIEGELISLVTIDKQTSKCIHLN